MSRPMCGAVVGKGLEGCRVGGADRVGLGDRERGCWCKFVEAVGERMDRV